MNRAFFLNSLAALSAAGLVIPEAFASNPESSLGEPDWDELRKHFSLPAGYRYFNTGGIGAVPIKIRQDVAAYWDQTEIHPKPGHSDAEWKKLKKLISDSCGAEGLADYFALTNSATEGINIILNGLSWKSEDEIITSTQEHPALHAPLINITQRFGVKVKVFEPDIDQGLNNVKRIMDLCTKRTRLIFISMVTCTSGQLFPVDEIINEAHKRGILVALDGAQITGTRQLHLKDMDVDFYTTGGQKWLLGPKRTGFLYVKPEKLDMLQPTTVGAYSEKTYDIKKGEIAWSPGAGRFEYATQNESLYHGLAKSFEFLNKLGFDKIQSHNESLSEHLYENLKSIDESYTISPKEKVYRTSMISIGLRTVKYQDLASELFSRSFRVRVVFEGGVEGVRISSHIYNSMDEIDALLEALKEISKANS